MKLSVMLLGILLFVVLPASASLKPNEYVDSTLATAIAGKWAATDEFPEYRLTSITEYFLDGTCAMDAKLIAQEGIINFQVKGTWKISGRKLKLTAIETSHPQLIMKGTVIEDDIVSITNDEMILIAEDGVRLVRKRIKSISNN